ncbi:MAG: hypothetical protein AB1649_27235 [Chloroflexota bacterium]
MSAYVVDTNVPIVANGQADHADIDCVLNSISMLKKLRKQGRILLDDHLRMLDEYARHLSRSGQPGPGDAFLKWVWENQANPLHCRTVAITPKKGDPEDFEEFPNDPCLSSFDRSDRKFVAVAMASQDNPEIVNATDTDWWDHKVALERHGLRVRFLCPELMAARR